MAFYGGFYYLGWVFYSRQAIIEAIKKAWVYLAVVSIVAVFLFCFYLPAPMSFQEAMALLGQRPEMTSMHILLSLLSGILACYGSFLCLWLACRFANQKNAFLRYLSDGSYWVYIIHLPVVIYLQYYFHDKDLPLVAEFLLISTMTLGAGYLSYALLVRPTPIGWLLNGRKKKVAKEANLVNSVQVL